MKNSPCKDCRERQIACHDRCEKYTTWRKERNIMLEANRIAGDIQRIISGPFKARKK